MEQADDVSNCVTLLGLQQSNLVPRVSSLPPLGPVHTYPDIFESATFSFRIRKYPRPHVM